MTPFLLGYSSALFVVPFDGPYSVLIGLKKMEQNWGMLVFFRLLRFLILKRILIYVDPLIESSFGAILGMSIILSLSWAI